MKGSTRALLLTAALLAVVAAAGAAALAAAPAAATAVVPDPTGVVVPVGDATLSRAAPSDGSATVGRRVLLVDPGAGFDLLGVLVRGDRPPQLGVTVAVRTSTEGTTWSAWLPLDFSGVDGPAGSAFDAADAVSEPVWVGPARYVQVRLEGPAAAIAAVAGTLRLACVESRWESGAGATAGDPAPASADSALPRDAAADPRLADKPAMVTRSQWGANESWRRDAPSYGAVKLVFVHHTVSSNSYTRAEAPAIVRSIYYYHAKVNGWSDIGYNFLVDRFGTIYEGRYGGVTRAVIGAQVLGFNSVSTGVSVIGTYTSAKPPQAAVDALEKLIAWKLDVHHVDPQATTVVQCLTGEKFSTGAWVRLNTISGHRQANYTTCPGNGIFDQLNSIRATVASIGNPKIYAPRASPAVFSPNGDGERDTANAVCTLSEEADWRVDVRDGLDQTVRSFSGKGTSVDVAWDGRGAGGARVADGKYSFVFSATAGDAAARAATVGLRLDTAAPAVHDARPSPAVVSPNGDGIADKGRLLFTVAEACRARVSLLDSQNHLVRRVRDWKSAPAGVNAVPWDGRAATAGGLAAAADGTYKIRVEARDAAGNTATATGSVLVDSSVGFPAVLPPYFSPNGDGVKDGSDLTFKLARQAKVTVTLSSASGPLRSWSLGTLGTGQQKVRWDGLDRSGTLQPSGRYTFSVTAVNAIGSVTIKAPVVVDRKRPRPAPTVTSASVRAGTTWKLSYKVTDPCSPSVHMKVIVTNRSGGVVTTADLGWVTRNDRHAWSYKPAARGRFTVTLRAVDRAGNHEAMAPTVALTVR